MSVSVYPRFVAIDDEERLTDACDNCGRQYMREMLCEVKDYFQRVDPGGVVPSGECPACGSLCYPIETIPKRVREWFRVSAWIYPKGEERFMPMLSENLKRHFGENCLVWQSEALKERKTYPQYLCTADPRGIGGDVVHLWRDGQTWWLMTGDCSLDDEDMVEAILKQTILEFYGNR
jgi:hypothetical protein